MSKFVGNQRPFNVHLFTSNAATPTIDAASTVTTGFSLDYTQVNIQEHAKYVLQKCITKNKSIKMHYYFKKFHPIPLYPTQ